VQLGANGKLLAERHKTEAIAAAVVLREPVEQALLKGARTLKEVAAYLNENGILTSEGARWAPGTVHRLLSRLGNPALIPNNKH
jgi:hypothetical protein